MYSHCKDIARSELPVTVQPTRVVQPILSRASVVRSDAITDRAVNTNVKITYQLISDIVIATLVRLGLTPAFTTDFTLL